ncbi:unnamed protein product [Rhizophagus irregularis]|nr:unnamed protein product [Rhizophagus irregularis]
MLFFLNLTFQKSKCLQTKRCFVFIFSFFRRRPVLCNIWKRGMFCDLFFRIFGRVGRGGYSAPFWLIFF